MKREWKYCRLGDVGKVITGSTPPTKEADNYFPEEYCFVKPSDLDKDGVSRIEDTEFHISKKGYRVSRQLPIGSVLTTCIGIIGKVGVLKKEATCNQQINAIIPSSSINSWYLAYAIIGARGVLESMANAPVVPIINKSDFSNITIPVPSKSEQDRIVAELDLLQGVIDKQKAQLKELDPLAQSIFYDMFGNPDTNSKGWKVQKLGELCSSELGKTLNVAKDTGTLRPYLCAINIHWNEIDKTVLKETRFETTELERYTVKKGDLLVCEGGDIGRSAIWKEEGGIQYQNALHRIRFNGKVLAIYCLYLLWHLKIHGILDGRYGKGVTIKHLVKSSLLSIPIPIPPLSLQLSFASKIEAIEQQKARINASIAETQKLFDYTMDKYFG